MAKKIQTPSLNPDMRQYKVGDGILTTPQFNGARARLRDSLTYDDQLGLERAEANLDLRRATNDYNSAVERLNQLVGEKKSHLQAAVEMMNPKKQEKFSEENVNREKRRAIATSLGNLFSAIAGGAMAGAGVGMGYVPQAAPNKSLAKLSQLEADYLKAGEDYRSAIAKVGINTVDQDIKLAEGAVKRSEQAVKDARTAIEDVEKRGKEMKAYREKSKILGARQIEVANNAATNSATATAQRHSNAMAKQNDSQAFTAEENEKNRTHRSEENEKNREAKSGKKPSGKSTTSIAERSAANKDDRKDAARKRINL